MIDGCFGDDGKPLRCPKCGSAEQTKIVRSTLDYGLVCEYEVMCSACGESIGYWAYGSWDPAYYQDRQ